MELSNTFYFWVFNCFCDSEYGNHGYRDMQAEYGISKAEMIDQYPQECIEDAKGYFDSTGEGGKEFREKALEQFKLHCEYMVEFYSTEKIRVELFRQEMNK